MRPKVKIKIHPDARVKMKSQLISNRTDPVIFRRNPTQDVFKTNISSQMKVQ